MDQWKAAFKQIYGKTPTKKDFSVAPLSIQTEFPKTLVKGENRKRKRLALKAEEFGSPLKLKRPADGYTKLTHERADEAQSSSAGNGTEFGRSVPSSSDLVPLMRAPSPSLRQLPFLSPVKNWGGFLSPKQTVETVSAISEFSADLFKTPSPARMGKRPIICANVGQLLTPEKSTISMAEKSDESSQLNEKGAETEMERELVEKKKRTQRKRKKQKVAGNFLTVNLRRRRFAPKSKVKGAKWKKNWKKFAKRQ
ncbi:hypothetical protein niasHS_017651 [Heterodera schachtii]|uniref:Uncharacterized protein n=1 Tax=Heterodera schachtii TaxID=97005 RepID=A0ABD2I457_HETSC